MMLVGQVLEWCNNSLCKSLDFLLHSHQSWWTYKKKRTKKKTKHLVCKGLKRGRKFFPAQLYHHDKPNPGPRPQTPIPHSNASPACANTALLSDHALVCVAVVPMNPPSPTTTPSAVDHSWEFKTAVYTVIIINTPIGTFTNVARQLFFFVLFYFFFFPFLFCFCFC